MIDPDKKEQRFKKHFKSLMNQYMALFNIYSEALKIAKQCASIDGVRAEKISLYLKDISDSFLAEYDNNPKKAINELTDFFEKEIASINSNKEIASINSNYDKMAIKFYLLDELIQCNVFPNPIE